MSGTAAVLLPQDNILYADLAKALVMSFMELGWSAMWLGDKDQIREYKRKIDVAVVLTPDDYPDIHRLLPRSTRVLYQLETLPWPERIHLTRRKYWRWEEKLKHFARYDAIWDQDMGNIREHYKWYTIQRPTYHVPIGYSSMFELNKRVRQRKVALFIGKDSNHPRYKHRNRTLRNLKGKLRRNFKLITTRYGDKAKQAAKNARVNLNIHENNVFAFEGLRMVGLLMSNKCFVLTEPCAYMEPFENFKHLVVTKHRDIAAEVKYYLDMAEWEIDRIAQNAYDFIKAEYTMTQHLQRALEQL